MNSRSTGVPANSFYLDDVDTTDLNRQNWEREEAGLRFDCPLSGASRIRCFPLKVSGAAAMVVLSICQRQLWPLYFYPPRHLSSSLFSILSYNTIAVNLHC